MRLPSLLGLLLLGYLLVFLPVAAVRSNRRLAAARGTGDGSGPSRPHVWGSTLVALGVLFALAFVTGREFGYEIFALPQPRGQDVAAGGVALCALFVLRLIARRVRTEAELRSSPMIAWLPRSGRDWALVSAVTVAAGIAEEAAYRGVGMSVLWWATGSAVFSAVVLSLAFAAAHAVQGWKSMTVIFPIALVMHALVAYTGTLVIAMVVHAVYDFLAIWLLTRESASWPEVAGA